MWVLFPLRSSRGITFQARRHAHRGASRSTDLRMERLEERTVLSAAAGGEHGHDSPFDSHLFQLERITYLPELNHVFDLETGYIAPPAAGDPLDIALDYLEDNAGQFGVTAADIASAVVTDQYVSDHTGVTHIYLTQTHNTLRVANTSINVNVGADGRVINAGGNFVRGLTSNFTDTSGGFKLSSAEALELAAGQLDVTARIAPQTISPAAGPAASAILSEPNLSLDDIPVQRVYVPTADGGVAPSWNMVLRTPDGLHWFDLGVDAATGEINSASDWASYASYKVFDRPLDAPNDLADPTAIAPRTLIVDPEIPLASPFGWHDINGVPGADTTDTRGNNVFAQEDADATDNGGFRPNGGAQRNFDFPIDFNVEPNLYVAATVTNLFYWNNLLHDVHYLYGFNETSGNFQFNNYGKGGFGGDQVFADAQDGSGFNNANFQTPPDGQNPRMQQFIFINTVPTRDSALDNGVVIHEYGHGVSRRLTGGAANSDALNSIQSRGMGEGWSDWWALMFTQKPTETPNTPRFIARYALGDDTIDGPGFRRVPYSFDLTVDPQSYSVYNGSSEVHDAGEIWASALWDMNWLLIDKYGFEQDIAAGYSGPGSAGNLLALQLVMDGLKLQPANPSFLDARDAILLADDVLTGGENAPEIWQAFARRGMGASAFDGGSANSLLVAEAFDIPILGLTVVSTNPVQQAAINTRPVDFTLNFSVPYVPGSVDAADLTINGIAASNFTLADADTIVFHFNSSPVTAQGPQDMRIARGALTEASDGDPGFAWQGLFYYDLVPMAVVSTTPAEGLIFTEPPSEIILNFNEPIDADSVGRTDLVLNVGTVRGVTVVDEDTLSFAISGIPTDNDVVVKYTLAAGAINDVHGTPGPQYDGKFSVDDINLLRIESPNAPFPIVDFTTTVSGLTVERSVNIIDLDVAIDITHTFVGELQGTLFSPGIIPISVLLFSFVGGVGDNFTDAIFDDEANRSITAGTPPYAGRFQPFEPLAVLEDTDALGTWRLEIHDFAAADVGSLNRWALLIRVDDAITIPGDTNGDGVVDIQDLNNVRNQFGAMGAGVLGDTLPFDGVVDINDLNAVRNNFGTSAGAPLVAAALPSEPTDPGPAPEVAGPVFDRLTRRRAAAAGRIFPAAAGIAADADAGGEHAVHVAATHLRPTAGRLAVADGLSRRFAAHSARPLRTVQADVWDAALESITTPEASIRRR